MNGSAWVAVLAYESWWLLQPNPFSQAHNPDAFFFNVFNRLGLLEIMWPNYHGAHVGLRVCLIYTKDYLHLKSYIFGEF